MDSCYKACKGMEGKISDRICGSGEPGSLKKLINSEFTVIKVLAAPDLSVLSLSSDSITCHDTQPVAII